MRSIPILALAFMLAFSTTGCDTVTEIAELAAFRAAVGCTTIGEITLGQTVNGSLTMSDCRVSTDQTFIDYFAFRVSSATTVQIDLQSDDFDAYLMLFSSNGTVLEEDDDGGEDFNSRIVRSMAPGLYVIGANSLDEGETGAYTLSAASASPTR
ncbi:hypothetical protein BH23BAC4_BH23BAC4_00640 [soil metagenome]